MQSLLKHSGNAQKLDLALLGAALYLEERILLGRYVCMYVHWPGNDVITS